MMMTIEARSPKDRRTAKIEGAKGIETARTIQQKRRISFP
jgi:hypothetical protein